MSGFFAPSFWAKVLWGQHPVPDKFYACPYPELPLLSLDLELTDLNTDIAKITSIGWVLGKMFDVDLSSAYYQVTRARGDLNQSPVIHGLCAKEIARGTHVSESVSRLKEYAESHVWVMHNASLDMRVLNRVWTLLEYEPVSVTTIDTMLLQVYALQKSTGYVPQGEVRLAASRHYYGLADAPEHNALDDALATLTLLYAQFHQLDKNGLMSLKKLAHTRAIKTFTLGQ